MPPFRRARSVSGARVLPTVTSSFARGPSALPSRGSAHCTWPGGAGLSTRPSSLVFRKSGSEDDFCFRGGRGCSRAPLRWAPIDLTRSDWAASAGETELPGIRGGKAGSRGRFRRCSLRRGGAFAPGPSPRLE
ncbi:unnamed protein product [Rangifer tarandus platyrhynchus]|uniref:Uncharacterized protein n=1 Tax=Rangifer tarandus platyrhynchus TaxID=3082113 RepID=A0AC59ZT14_RANTA